ncbi:MAG: hypothetical protein ACP5VC_03735 [Bryobacteraceae bacterium]
MVAVWKHGGREAAVSTADSFQGYLARLLEQQTRPPARLVYPYSVVPGGVASPEEVAEAMLRDPVVARHYAGFDLKRARVETLRQPRLAYVSYRIKDRVFFTRKPVRLYAGEQVITDGKTTIRARCGNKVEEAPQAAVSPEEPAEEVLNAPKLEPEKAKEAPLGAPALEAAKPEEETPLAAVVPPSSFAPLDIPVRPGGIWLTPPPAGGGFLPPAGPGAAGAPPAAPPGTPPAPPAAPPPVSPPPSTPPGTPTVPPPPVTPPTAPPSSPPTTPPGTPPATPPATPPSQPPGTPPATPPAVPPGTPPATPPASPPLSPPGVPPEMPPATPPGTPPGTPPLPPPLLPPPGGTPETPASEPPPEIVVPPPPGNPPPEIPEPPPVPEPSTYTLVAAGLLALSWIRRRRAGGR